MNKTISEFVEDEYKSYSKYVLYHRAIPSVIDGFKMVQRKAFYLLKDEKKFQKTASIGANLISKANYNHGDMSANAAISLMAQDFIGSNNYSLLESKGNFGNRFITEPSAARYTYIKKSSIIDYLFADYDLCPINPDPEYPEPLFYLPVIPTVLINGIQGIAIGFATNIPSYNIFDIIRNVKHCIKEENLQKKLIPYYKNYSGEIKENEEGKIVQYGVYKIIDNTTIQIKEIPINFDREKYLNFLNNLIDKGQIKNYEENTKEYWDIIIKLPKNSKIWKNVINYLKLEYIISINLTTIDIEGNVKIFENPEKLIEYFVQYRLKKYEERRLKRIEEFKEKIRFVNEKIRFINEALKFSWKNKSKKQILKFFEEEKKFEKNDLDKFFEIALYNLNIDTIKTLKDNLHLLKKRLEFYNNITNKELYQIDLESLENYLSKNA